MDENSTCVALAYDAYVLEDDMMCGCGSDVSSVLCVFVGVSAMCVVKSMVLLDIVVCCVVVCVVLCRKKKKKKFGSCAYFRTDSGSRG